MQCLEVTTMSQTTKEELKSELKKSAALLKQLGDEVRLQIHLSGMDAKDAWQKLEPRVESALERAAKDVSDASREAVTDLTEAVRKLRASMH